MNALITLTPLLAFTRFAEANSPILCSEFITDPLPTPRCHASTLAESGGHLVAAWFGGTREKNPDVGIWLARQVDGKWLPAKEVANGVQPDGTRDPCWNPVLFQPKNGPLLLFFKIGPEPPRWWGMLMTSSDHGATWSAPRRLPDGIVGPVKNKPLERPDGRLLCGSSDEQDRRWRLHIEWTDDNGRTWSRTGPLNDGITIGAIQPSLLTLADERLQAIGRTQQGKIFSIRSADGGKTWDTMTLLDLPNPNSGTDALTLADGRQLLVYNPVTKGRSPLAVALSDDGITWENVLTLESEPAKEFSYPAVIQTSDGKIHITYTWKRRNVKHVVLDPAQLKDQPQSPVKRMTTNNPGATADLAVGLWPRPLPLDIDGDGDLDLAVTSTDLPYNGLYLFENPTPPGTSNKNPMPLFKAGRRMGAAQPNAQIGYANGQPNILTPAKRYPDFKASGFSKGVGIPGVKENVHKNKVRANIWLEIDYDGDGTDDLVVGAEDWKAYGWDNAYTENGKWTNGPLHGLIYWMRNTGTARQPAYAAPVLICSAGKPIDVYGNPSPTFHDFDGDGDLDLICGEFLDGFTYFENTGTRQVPRYAEGRRLKTPEGAEVQMELEMIAPVGLDWDGDGDWDLICGDEDGRVAFIENTGRLGADRAPLFRAPRYFRQEAADLKFGALATPWGCDWDGDGDWDLICGNSAGFIALIENLSGPGVAEPKWAEPKRLEADGETIRIQAGPNGSIQGPAEAKWGYTTVSVGDWDGDGLPDILANSIWGDVIWYRNSGTRHAAKLEAARPIEVEWQGAQPRLAWGWRRPKGKALLTQWRTTPVVFDWNKDGLPDLVMLDQEGYLAYFERAVRNGQRVLLPPKRVFCDEKGAPLRFATHSAGHSGRRKLCLADWDGDSLPDLLINSKNAECWRQVGQKDGTTLFRNLGAMSSTPLAGHTTSPTVVDFNADGIPDLVLGAEDGHFYFLPNPRAQ